MAMPQRDETIEGSRRMDALLGYTVMHGDEAEAVRRRTRPHRIHGIIHSHRSPQIESRCNRTLNAAKRKVEKRLVNN